MRATRLVVTAVPLTLLVLIFLYAPLIVPSASSAESSSTTAEAEARPGYVGSETCAGCHEDVDKEFAETRMGRLFLKHPRTAREKLGCEGCHGPGEAHVNEGGGKGVGGLISFAKDDPHPVSERNAVCLQCHNRKNRLFWEGSQHDNRGLACTNCHMVMRNILAPGGPPIPEFGLTKPEAGLAKPTVTQVCRQCHLRQAASEMYNAHMPLREGKMDCTSCHNPHGTVTQKLLKGNSLNDVCFKCHADKRGPFLWEHPPVVESCANCHSPHGSNHESMLVLPKPRLCQNCHIEARHPTEAHTEQPIPDKFVAFRACVTCHYNVHGSNHPSGYRFTR